LTTRTNLAQAIRRQGTGIAWRATRTKPAAAILVGFAAVFHVIAARRRDALRIGADAAHAVGDRQTSLASIALVAYAAAAVDV
jgi:hypothetical protein